MSNAKRKTGVVLLMLSMMMLLLTQTAQSAGLQLTIFTSDHYDLGKNVSDLGLNGTLTLNGSPVPDGLVAVQVNDPRGDYPEHNNTFIVRVFSTGTTPPGPWPVELLEVIPCDLSGNPKNSFPRGGSAGIKVSVINHGASPQHVLVIVTLLSSDGTRIAAFMMMDNQIDPSQTPTSTLLYGDLIPGNAPVGPAYVYAVALNYWIQYGGHAWCPEKSASFTITSGGGGGLSTLAKTNENYSVAQASPGFFDVSFKTSAFGGVIGNYTLYANSWYNNTWFASQTKKVQVVLITDVTGDGKVDMKDLVYVILRYGSSDPTADINKDGTVDMKDIVKVILGFGEWGILP